MAKRSKGKAKKTKVVQEEERVTLDAIEAMSSDEEGGNDVDDEEMNAEAQALRQAIADGAFNRLLKKSKGNEDDEEEDEENKEVEMDERSDESDDEDDNDSSDSDKEEVAVKNDKALAVVLEEMTAAKKGMPWAETFDVIPAEPLPFTESPLDVHDDLKREVAFYNVALEAVKEARNRCIDAGIPFSRPEDFFAEMVKSDGTSGGCDTCSFFGLRPCSFASHPIHASLLYRSYGQDQGQTYL